MIFSYGYYMEVSTLHSQLWQVYEKWRKKFNCIDTEKMPESHLDQMIENAVEGVLPSEKRDGTDVLLTRGCNEPGPSLSLIVRNLL